MALEYDGCGNWKHSAVCYIMVRSPEGHKYVPVKSAKPYTNDYDLDLMLITNDVFSEDGKRKLSSAGSLIEGMTGLKLCDDGELEKCINTRGLEAVRELIAKMRETYGWSPRYLRPDEKKSDVFPKAETDDEDRCILVAPLFVDGMYNRSRKRMRAKFIKTVSCDDVSYDLYISGSKNPDNAYPASEDDKYYLYIWLNGWLIPLGMTQHYMWKHATMKAVVKQMYGDEAKREEVFDNLRADRSYTEAKELVAEQIKKEDALASELAKDGKLYAKYIKVRLDGRISNYNAYKNGDGGYPDFIGAAVINDLDNCDRLAEQRRQEEELEREAYIKQKEEQERQEAAAEAEQAAKRISEVEAAIRKGGEKVSGGELLCALADKHNVTIPLKTRGWILHYFVSYELMADGSISVRYIAKNKQSKGSTKIYEIIRNIRDAVNNAAMAV